MAPTVPRYRRAAAFIVGVAVAGTVTGVLASDVDTTLTADDVRSIESLHVGAACGDVGSFATQLTCLRAIQAAHLAVVPDLTCVDEYGVTSHEPSAFLERARGCCYDRSRLIEKAAEHHGLRVRHVAIYNAHAATDLLRGGIPSHSTTEVFTERGWMIVDSNSAMLGLTTDGTPLDAEELAAALRLGTSALEPGDYHNYFAGEFIPVYGLYSRHGGFYPPYVRLPDIDWAQIHHNF